MARVVFYCLICGRLIGLTKQIRPGLLAHLHEEKAGVAGKECDAVSGRQDRLSCRLRSRCVRLCLKWQTDRRTPHPWQSSRERARADAMKARAHFTATWRLYRHTPERCMEIINAARNRPSIHPKNSQWQRCNISLATFFHYGRPCVQLPWITPDGAVQAPPPAVGCAVL